jgi:hypothetical protein
MSIRSCILCLKIELLVSRLTAPNGFYWKAIMDANLSLGDIFDSGAALRLIGTRQNL